jgi:hypothetical protein
MSVLRELFPDGKADTLNVVLFSTSGVHGHYGTIEDAENTHRNGGEGPDDVTFVIVHPRMCTLRYGNAAPECAADFDFLKKLRASSIEEVAKIGMP